ncbi:MAG: inositol monophosphatase [Halobacteriaceae archaeon]
MVDTAGRARTAERAARRGARVATRRFRTELAVETKDGPTDYVTDADRAAEAAVLDTIGEAYPGDRIIAEERTGPEPIPDAGPVWVVDPIDGTSNFVRGSPVWATSVAAVVDGETVAAATVMPALGDAYIADADTVYRNDDPVAVSECTDCSRAVVCPTIWWPADRSDDYAAVATAIVTRFADLRRVGSAQATLALVAAGAVEGAVAGVRAHPWDTVAGVHLVRTAGGRVTDPDGGVWHPDSTGLVASNGHLHADVAAVLGGGRG